MVLLADACGGSDIPVTVFGARHAARACALHGAWDFDLIDHVGLDERRCTAYLEKMIAGSHLDAGGEDPAQWANDSWKLAKEALVSPGANLDDQYYTVARPVIDQQLALAGLRLARLLNQDLGGEAVGPAPPPAPAPAPAGTAKPK
jgi:hypothetical protein